MPVDKNKSIKAIFFVTNLDSGGLENYLLRFLKQFSNRFEDIVVFCKSGQGGALEEQFRRIANVQIHKQKVGNFNIVDYFRLRKWFYAYRDYAVCDFTGNFAAPVLLVAKTLKIQRRIVFYRSSSNRFKETFFRLKVNSFYNRLIVSNASHILANSSYAFRFFFSKNSIDSRFQVIFNGIDVDDFLSETDNLRSEFFVRETDFVIGHTGRYNPAKNHITILEVAKILVERYPNVRFILCGKGVKANLSKRILEYGLADKVILFENRNDISKFLNTCDAYFFPSITEGQPNSLIEAWAKGLPFVASNIPSITDVISNDFKMYLKDPYDVNGFVDSLSKIVEEPFSDEKRSNLASWAKKTFDSNIRFEEFYQIFIS